MNGVVASASTMVVTKKAIANDIKASAVKLAETYGTNIQVQIDIRKGGEAVLRITEFNV